MPLTDAPRIVTARIAAHPTTASRSTASSRPAGTTACAQALTMNPEQVHAEVHDLQHPRPRRRGLRGRQEVVDDAQGAGALSRRQR